MPRTALLLLPSSLLLSCAPSAVDSGAAERPAVEAKAPEASAPEAGGRVDAEARMAAHAQPILADGDTDGFAFAVPGAAAVALFTADGVSLGGPDARDPLVLQFSSWGSRGAEAAVGPAAPTLGACVTAPAAGGECVQRLEFIHGDVTAWWVGLDGGLEFGWTVAAPPAGGAGDLTFRVDVAGAVRVDAAGDGATLRDAAGNPWDLSAPVAWGADGAALPARLGVEGDALVVQVDARGAVYPVTVDPVLSTPSRALVGTMAGEWLGTATDGAGDVNGDGYDDIIVASWWNSLGRVYIHHGSATGISSTANSTVTGTVSSDRLGHGVAGAGDVNGDGFDDVVIGAPGIDTTGRTDRGAAFVHHGSAAGVSSSPTTTIYGAAAFDGAGTVAGAGDINGDGYDDIIVGSPDHAGSTGRATVHLGSASGVSTTAHAAFTGTAPDDFLGSAVAGAGDVNGDGYDDVLIGAYGYDDGSLSYAGRVMLYHGSASGLSATPQLTLTGTIASAFFGVNVASAGDVNGDGYDDILIASQTSPAAGSTGVVSIYHGSPSGVDPVADRVLTGTSGSHYFGRSAVHAGDTDGNGYSDVVIGEPGYHVGSYPGIFVYVGSASLYHGSASGLSALPANRWYGGAQNDFFGWASAGAGDVNGDGRDDILVGSYRYDTSALPDAGLVLIHHGYSDADGDGLIVGGNSTTTQDCDDTNPGIGGPVYRRLDADGDGFGMGWSFLVCPGTPGTAVSATDCDDTRADINPGAQEVCDAANTDEDCDGRADDLDSSTSPTGFITTYGDSDGDAFGDPADVLNSCDIYPGFVVDNTDCDPTRADIHPLAAEVCDAANTDEDCDGLVNDADPTVAVASFLTFYADADGDTFGAAASPTGACALPAGHVLDNTDCDDTRADISPAGQEVCDAANADEDCDGRADDGDSSVDESTTTTVYYDRDGDGFGDPAAPTNACDLPRRHVTDNTDCDDFRAVVNPAGTDTPGDGIDQDCSGADAASTGGNGGNAGLDPDDAGLDPDDVKGGCTVAPAAPSPALALLLALPALVLRRRRA